MDHDLVAVLRTGPFHAALRAAISARGLALQRLQHRLDQSGLHVGVGTLSYWQSGRRRPERPESLRAVAALEEILGLPPRSLIVLLGPPRPRGRAARLPRPARRYAELAAPVSPLARLIGAVDGRLRLISTYDDVTVGAGRAIRRHDHLQVVEARQEADRHLAVFEGGPGCDTDRVAVTAVDNCRIGRIRRDRNAGLVVAELLFGKRLAVGDTQILRYRFVEDNAVPAREYCRVLRVPTQQVTLQVRFQPGALPARCWRLTTAPDGTDIDGDELVLGPHHSVHLVARDLSPGAVGIRWAWQ